MVGILFFVVFKAAPSQLVDENGAMPHQRFTPPGGLEDAAEFALLERIWNVGFQQSVGLRFQSANELRQLLTIPSPIVPEAETVLQSLASRLDSLEAGAFAHQDQSLVDSLQEFASQVISLGKEHGYTFGRNSPGVGPSKKGFNLNINRNGRSGPKGTIHCHTFGGRTKLWFQFGEQGAADPTGRPPVMDLPAADVTGIRAALVRHAETYLTRIADYWSASLDS